MKRAVTPDKKRAMSIPSSMPDTTIDRAVLLRCGGAISPTNGSMICGVTVVTEVMKDIAPNAAKELVMHSPILRTFQHMCPIAFH